MPLLIDGNQYELQLSVSDFIVAYPKFKESAQAFCSKEPRHCGPVDLLYVNQREYAVTHPGDNVVKVLGSDDATTCHIVVIRHSSSGATGLSHVDGHGIAQGIDSLLAAVTGLSTDCSDGRLELHLFGGFCDDRGESEKITTEVLEIFQKCSSEVHLVTACMSDLNDVVKNGTHWPVLYGVAVDVTSGEIFPATFADKGPDQALRSVYSLFGEHHIRNVYDHGGGLHLISPFLYHPWPHAAICLQQPDAFIRKNMSTSPEVEPPYFERNIRDALRWVLDHPRPALTVFPDNKSRVYRKSAEGHWVDNRETQV